MELVFLQHFDDINFVLSKTGNSRYNNANEINNEQIQLLKGIRSKQSELFNVQFLQNNEKIAQNLNNVGIRALTTGINLNINYKYVPQIVLRTDEMKQKYSKYFWEYQTLFRVAIFGFTYLSSKLYYKISQWFLKYGVRFMDKFLDLFMDKDSKNKQWVAAILMCILTLQYSSGFAKFFDVYSIYQGYKLYSDDFQSEIRKFSNSISYFEKKVD